MWAEREDTNRDACRLEKFYRLLIEILDVYFGGMGWVNSDRLRFDLNGEYVLAYTKVEQILKKPSFSEFFCFSEDSPFIPYDNVLFDDRFDYESTNWFTEGGGKFQAETFVHQIQQLIAESGGQHSDQSQEEEALIQKARNIISTYHNESEQAKKRRKLEREARNLD